MVPLAAVLPSVTSRFPIEGIAMAAVPVMANELLPEI